MCLEKIWYLSFLLYSFIPCNCSLTHKPTYLPSSLTQLKSTKLNSLRCITSLATSILILRIMDCMPPTEMSAAAAARSDRCAPDRAKAATVPSTRRDRFAARSERTPTAPRRRPSQLRRHDRSGCRCTAHRTTSCRTRTACGCRCRRR